MLVEIVTSGIPWALIILAIHTQDMKYQTLAVFGFLVHYGYYRAKWLKTVKTQRSMAQICTKNEIKAVEEVSPHMGDLCSGFYEYLRLHSLIKKNIERKKHTAILDNGCGDCSVGLNLTGPGKYLIGLDISKNHILAGKRRAHLTNAENVEFVVGDSENLPFKKECFDVVIGSEIIEHVPNHSKFLVEAEKVLKGQGIMVLTTPNAHSTPESLNPLIWFERILGVHFNSILCKRRSMIYLPWTDSFLIHRDFTIKELIKITEHANFVVANVRTVALLPIPTSRIFPFFIWSSIEKILEKIPMIKQMGWHIVLFAKKPDECVHPNL